jgi:hypothetical protein
MPDADTAHIYAYRLANGEYRTRLTVGVQTFDLQPDRVSEEEAVWMGDMLAKALARAGATEIMRTPPPAEGSKEWAK